MGFGPPCPGPGWSVDPEYALQDALADVKHYKELYERERAKRLSLMENIMTQKNQPALEARSNKKRKKADMEMEMKMELDGEHKWEIDSHKAMGKEMYLLEKERADQNERYRARYEEEKRTADAALKQAYEDQLIERERADMNERFKALYEKEKQQASYESKRLADMLTEATRRADNNAEGKQPLEIEYRKASSELERTRKELLAERARADMNGKFTVMFEKEKKRANENERFKLLCQSERKRGDSWHRKPLEAEKYAASEYQFWYEMRMRMANGGSGEPNGTTATTTRNATRITKMVDQSTCTDMDICACALSRNHAETAATTNDSPVVTKDRSTQTESAGPIFDTPSSPKLLDTAGETLQTEYTTELEFEQRLNQLIWYIKHEKDLDNITGFEIEQYLAHRARTRPSEVTIFYDETQSWK